MIFASTFAAIFYTAVVGIIWQNREPTAVTDWLFNALTRSLWISWLLVVASFWLNLPNLLWAFALLVGAIALVIQRRGNLSFSVPWSVIAMVVALSSIIFAASIARGVYTGEYRVIFHGWDALVSWNGWGRELARNEFTPQPAAYPVLFPGIWSLIYKAQGNTDLWVITKASMFTLIPILTFAVARLLEARLIIASVIIGLFACDFYFIRQHQPMLSGNMDIPVAILILVAGISLIIASVKSEEDDSEQLYPALVTSAVAVGLASITKQAGAFMLLPLFVAFFVAAMRRQVSARQISILVVTGLLPLATFLTMYFSAQGNPIGNIGHLRGLSAAGAGSSLSATIDLLFTAVPEGFLFFLIAAAFLNLFAIVTLPGMIGAALAAMAVAGTVIFSNCCAYDIRNGWWIFSLLALSAAFGLLPIDRWIASRAGIGETYSIGRLCVAGTAVAFAFAAAIGLSLVLDKDHLQRVQDEWQSGVVQPELAALIADNSGGLGETGRVISAVQPLGFLPSIRGRYEFCYYLEGGCVERAIRKFPGSMVLVSPSEGTYYEDFRESLTKENLVGTALIFELYGPYE